MTYEKTNRSPDIFWWTDFSPIEVFFPLVLLYQSDVKCLFSSIYHNCPWNTTMKQTISKTVSCQKQSLVSDPSEVLYLIWRNLCLYPIKVLCETSSTSSLVLKLGRSDLSSQREFSHRPCLKSDWVVTLNNTVWCVRSLLLQLEAQSSSRSVLQELIDFEVGYRFWQGRWYWKNLTICLLKTRRSSKNICKDNLY